MIFNKTKFLFMKLVIGLCCINYSSCTENVKNNNDELHEFSIFRPENQSETDDLQDNKVVETSEYKNLIEQPKSFCDFIHNAYIASAELLNIIGRISNEQTEETQSDTNIEDCFIHASEINRYSEILDKMCQESSFQSIIGYFQNIKSYLSKIQEIIDKYKVHNITGLEVLKEQLNKEMDFTIVECLINKKDEYANSESLLHVKGIDIKKLKNSFENALRTQKLSEDIVKQRNIISNYLNNMIDNLTLINDNITTRLSKLVQDYQYGCLLWEDMSKLAHKYPKYQAEITKCRKILQQPLLVKIK